MRMRWSSQRRPSVALAVARIALFVALGGGATAAQKVLFTGKDIKKKSLTGKHLKNRSIGPKHLNQRALAMLNPGTATPVAGQKGAQGVKGVKGDRGAKGAPGVNCFDADKKLNTPEPGTVESCRGERGPRGPRGQEGRQGPAGTGGGGTGPAPALFATVAGVQVFANFGFDGLVPASSNGAISALQGGPKSITVTFWS